MPDLDRAALVRWTTSSSSTKAPSRCCSAGCGRVRAIARYAPDIKAGRGSGRPERHAIRQERVYRLARRCRSECRAATKCALPLRRQAATVTGLRPGEALALQWRDIREQTILVERAISLGEEKDTKTAAHRTVRLLAPLAGDLKEWRLRSGRPGETTLVFPSAAGTPWTQAAYQSWRRRAFRRAFERRGWSTAARMTCGTRSLLCSSMRGVR